MVSTVEDNTITLKTRELCQSILDHPDFQNLRRDIDAFMADDGAKQDYQTLVEQGEELHHKQHQGVRLSQGEIDSYESLRQKVVANPLAASFIRAQQEVQHLQESVGKYVAKTLELGRVPNEDELSDGSCGHGCGCSH
jgi:cell fate (sporulation/competence/biofilm development) regulator YlbF (YheA/YmcA/DUF963 family)